MVSESQRRRQTRVEGESRSGGRKEARERRERGEGRVVRRNVGVRRNMEQCVRTVSLSPPPERAVVRPPLSPPPLSVPSHKGHPSTTRTTTTTTDELLDDNPAPFCSVSLAPSFLSRSSPLLSPPPSLISPPLLLVQVPSRYLFTRLPIPPSYPYRT